MKYYCTYLRVSTQKQGKTMLGIEAQRKMCKDFVIQNDGNIKHEFMDIESGTHRDRKGLQDAIMFCKTNGYPLVIAKLDRLARDVEFCFKVINTGIEIHFCDMPTINTLLLGVFASVAQYERELTSDRTKKALAVKKKQGFKLGAASAVYKMNKLKKDKDLIKQEDMDRGQTKREHWQASRDVQTFLKVLKRVQPEHCTAEDPKDWEWGGINSKCGRREQMLQLMKDFKEMDEDGKLFRRWNLANIHSRQNQMRLCAFIQRTRTSFTNG